MARLPPYWHQRFNGVPVLEDWALTINHIEDIWATPCEVDPEIAVLAGFHELPLLIWSLVKPTPVDAAFDRYRGPQGHRRRRKGGNRNRFPPFRWSAQGYLPGERLPPGGPSGAAWKLGALAQRAGFFFLIADATIDFGLRWSSTVYQWQGCLPPDMWVQGVTGPANPPGGLVGDAAKIAWVGTTNTVPQQHIYSTFILPRFQEAFIRADITLQYGGFLQCDHLVACDLVEQITGDRREVVPSTLVTPTTDASGSAAFKLPMVHYDRTFAFEVSNGGSPCTCRVTTDSTMSASAIVDTFLEADPP